MPIDVKCHSCHKQYRLKDELSGKKFKCKQCGEIVLATPLPSQAAPPASRPARPGRKLPSETSPKKKSATSSRSAKPTPPRKKKRPKQKPAQDLYADDYRDPLADDGFGSTLDDFDDYGDTYDDNPFADELPKKKKTKRTKKKSSSGGLSVGFNIHWLNIGMVVAGVAIIIVGLTESRLAAKAQTDPTQISLSDLVANGDGGNIYLTVSGVSCILEETVVYGDERPGGQIANYDKVWIPCVPSGQDAVGANVKFLLFSRKADTDDEVVALARGGTYTGLIVNDVAPISNSERQLLESGFPGANLRDAIIFEVDRTPAGAGAVVAYFLGGAVLSLGGLAWVFLGGGGSTSTASPVRSVSSPSKKRKAATAIRNRKSAPKSLSQILFSFEGRINRTTYWLSALGTAVAFLVLALLLSVVLSAVKDVPALQLVGVLFFLGLWLLVAFIQIAISAKRWHDRGKSGWMVAVGFIPIAGPLWTFIECGCLPGTDGPNEFGAEP